MLWKQQPTLEGLQRMSEETMVETLGIEFTEIGEDFLRARMPVDHRTVQPARLLHGGASAALAETLGSVAGVLCLEDVAAKSVVGVDINASHLRGVREGFVYGTVKPYRIGRKVQVWNIEIVDERERLICVSRLTLAVVDLQ